LDNWYGRALKTVNEMNSKFRFSSPQEGMRALEGQLREGFNRAKQESLDIHHDGSQHDSPFKYEE
jgi:hypothetical protein